MAELFSVSLGENAWARMAPDEREEVANGVFKTRIKTWRSSVLPKMAPIATLREVAISEIERAFVDQPRTPRDRCRELARKRAPDFRKAVERLRLSPLFDGGLAKEHVVALDGRPFSQEEGEPILSAPQQAEEKYRDVVLYFVFNDKSKQGATKKRVFSIPAVNKTLVPTRKSGRKAGLKDNMGNAYAGGVEVKAVLLNAYAALQGGQGLSEEQLFKMLAEIGTTTTCSTASITGGGRREGGLLVLSKPGTFFVRCCYVDEQRTEVETVFDDHNLCRGRGSLELSIQRHDDVLRRVYVEPLRILFFGKILLRACFTRTNRHTGLQYNPS